MTDKELKRLRRGELLELLVEQGRQVEQLKRELEEARQALASREIAIREAGTLAEAALKLNGVFEAADAAVKQYMENLKLRTRGEGLEGLELESLEEEGGAAGGQAGAQSGTA